MTSGLKITIFSSVTLACLLNVFQFAAAAHPSAQAAFVPSWVSSTVAPASPSPSVPAAPTLNPAAAAAPAAAPAPAPDPAVKIASRLVAAHLKPDFAASYLSAQQKTGTPWQLLASVHQMETGQSGNTNRQSYAGATGPMQFMPATFRAYGLDGDANGTTDITDVDDALLSAGNYLRAGGADKGHYSAALYNYNHSSAYVSRVLAIATTLGL